MMPLGLTRVPWVKEKLSEKNTEETVTNEQGAARLVSWATVASYVTLLNMILYPLSDNSSAHLVTGPSV